MNRELTADSPLIPPSSLKARMPQVLRYLGAAVLVTAAIAYVAQNWHSLDSVTRYFVFLAFSLTLTLCGGLCALGFKEDKGARTFVGLAATFLPVHALYLGGFLFHALNGTPDAIPPLFVVAAPDLTAVGITFLAAIPLLIFIAYAGIAALARSAGRSLTATYLLLNALLLIPVRESNNVALLFAAGAVFAVSLEYRRFRNNPLLASWEGRSARRMLILPLLALIIRNAVLYSVTSLLIGAALAVLSAVILTESRQGELRPERRTLAEFYGIALATFSWLFTGHGLFFERCRSGIESWNCSLVGVADDWVILVYSLGAAVIIATLSFTLRSSGTGYRRFASVLAVSSLLVHLFQVGGLVPSILCVLVSALIITTAFVAEEKWLLYTGVFGFVAGLLAHVKYAVVLYSMSPWLMLAVAGISIVLLSSYCERNFDRLREQWRSFRERLSSWR